MHAYDLMNIPPRLCSLLWRRLSRRLACELPPLKPTRAWLWQGQQGFALYPPPHCPGASLLRQRVATSTEAAMSLPRAEEGPESQDVSLDALLSIRHQRLVRHVKAVSGDHRRHVLAYCRQYEAGESIHEIARRVCYPPYLLARMLVEVLCKVETRTKVTELMRAPHLIANHRLRREVMHCIAVDIDFSPGADRVSRSIGLDYERELQLRLRALAVPFEDEAMLRARGLPKTPDVRLSVPLGVVDACGKHHVVNWIDSKALYGTRETFEGEVLPQVTRYVNRFGPGCVVFWFGFCPGVQELLSAQECHVVVIDDFPPPVEKLVFLNGDVLETM